MTDMKRPPVQKLRNAPMLEEMPKAEYPYGLRIRCEKDELDKLNLTLKDYDIGDVVKFNIKTEVMSLSSSESYEGNESQCIEFQIVDMTKEKK